MRLIILGVPGVIVKVPTCNTISTPLMENHCKWGCARALTAFHCLNMKCRCGPYYFITEEKCDCGMGFLIFFFFFKHRQSRLTFFLLFFRFGMCSDILNCLNWAVPLLNCNYLLSVGQMLKSDLISGPLMSLKQILGPLPRSCSLNKVSMHWIKLDQSAWLAFSGMYPMRTWYAKFNMGCSCKTYQCAENQNVAGSLVCLCLPSCIIPFSTLHLFFSVSRVRG